MMTYEEVLAEMDHTWRVNDDNRIALLRQVNDWLGNTDQSLRIVHVTGTNGKGTVIEMTSSILAEAGYAVGTFTSPAIFDDCEQIQLNHKQIPKPNFVALYQIIRDVLLTHGYSAQSLSAFEYWTLIALLAFSLNNVDVAIIEAGMGGKNDATHLIARPGVVAFTEISLDHMQWLGETVTEIAANKAALIMPGSYVVSATQHPDVSRILKGRTALMKANWYTSLCQLQPDDVRANISDGEKLGHDENMCLVFQILNILTGDKISIKTKSLGLAKAKLFGRQTVFKDESVIVDGAHNRGSAQKLADIIAKWRLSGKVILILGMLEYKETDVIQETLAPHARHIIGVTPDNPRALPGEQISEHTEPLDKALEVAKSMRQPGEWIVVAGSFYTIKGVIGDEYLVREWDAAW